MTGVSHRSTAHLLLRRRTLLAAAGATLLAPSAARAIPIERVGGLCVVTVSLGGRPARLVLDTGAERSVVTRGAVGRLALPLDPWVGTRMRGAGGRLDEHQNAVVRGMALGDIRLFQRAPGQALSLPVTSLDLGGLDGLLGGDVLRHHAVVLDMPAGRVDLLDARPERATAQGAIRLELLRRVLPLAAVRLDGRPLTALIDTGAAVSLVNARGLARLGLDPKRLGADLVQAAQGIGGSFQARLHRFAELQLGPLRIASPVLLAGETPEPAFDMVIGLDVLGRQPMRLSYAASTLETV